MAWISWAVLILAVLWALTTNMHVRNHYKTTNSPALGANMLAMIQTFSVTAVLALHKSPLHLLWLFPLSYAVGLVFNPFSSKIVAFLPWLYGYFIAYTIPSKWTGDLERTRTDKTARVPKSSEIVRAVLEEFAKEPLRPFGSPDFELYLKQLREEGTRALMRDGYRIRLVERRVMGNRAIVPAGRVGEILKSDKSSGEKVSTITEYLDTHDLVGLGEPVAPYVLAPLNEMRRVFELLVTNALESNFVLPKDAELNAEAYHRFLAYGYIRRVAEEIVGPPEGLQPIENS